MSRENVAIVAALFERTNARDFSAVMDAYADDIVLAHHGDVQAVGGEGAVGKRGVGEWFGDRMQTFDRNYRFEIEELRELGDRVLVVAVHHGRGRASGAEFARRAAWVYTLREGEIVRCDVYDGRAEALEASGFSA